MRGREAVTLGEADPGLSDSAVVCWARSCFAALCLSLVLICETETVMAALWDLSAGWEKHRTLTHLGAEREMAVTFAGWGTSSLIFSWEAARWPLNC